MYSFQNNFSSHLAPRPPIPAYAAPEWFPVTIERATTFPFFRIWTHLNLPPQAVGYFCSTYLLLDFLTYFCVVGFEASLLYQVAIVAGFLFMKNPWLQNVICFIHYCILLKSIVLIDYQTNHRLVHTHYWTYKRKISTNILISYSLHCLRENTERYKIKSKTL